MHSTGPHIHHLIYNKFTNRSDIIISTNLISLSLSSSPSQNQSRYYGHHNAKKLRRPAAAEQATAASAVVDSDQSGHGLECCDPSLVAVDHIAVISQSNGRGEVVQ